VAAPAVDPPRVQLDRLVTPLAGFALRLFYRRRSLGGSIPDRGPLVLVANHPNGLVDPLAILLLTRRPLRFLGKAPLFEMPVVGRLLRGMQALPVYRAIDGADTSENRGTFDAVYDALDEGAAICLFPEGVSHSEPALQKLKTGAARMAVGAEARAGFGLGVRIVPVGLVYSDKSRFRSRLVTWIGEPIEVAALRAAHEAGERGAVAELTDRITRELERVTINVEQWEDLPLLETARRIWRRGDADRIEELQALARGLAWLRAADPERVERLELLVARFRSRVRSLGVRVENLEREYTTRRVLRFVLRQLVLAPAGALVVAAGTLLWWLPFRGVGLAARLLRPDGETEATLKLSAAVVLFPLGYAALCALAWALAGPPALLATAVLAPPLGVGAVLARERLRASVADVLVFLRFGGAARLERRLVERRRAIAREFDELYALYAAEHAGRATLPDAPAG